MLKACHYFLLFRGDFILLILITGSACFWLSRKLKRHEPSCAIPRKAFVAAALVTLAGGILAEWAAHERLRQLERLFAGFGPTYATELAQHGHEAITLDTPADDPHYLELIGHEKSWLAANPIVSDIYTFRKDAAGRIRLIVDSETDYNHNGRIDETREERTPIGEIYAEATPKFYRALRGETLFETDIVADRWGIWVSSFAPIYDRAGRVEAAVGIDYPAESWLVAIGNIRAISLGVALVMNVILLSSSMFIAFLSAEIEQRKFTLQRLQQASESAFSASSAKSQFLALMSHEVRTPLSAILGFANILQDTRLDPKQRRYVETINRAGSGLLALLNNILDYTRVESGRVELENVAWAPALLVHEVMELITVRADERGLQLNFDNQLPGALTLQGDPTRVRQILINLLSNAVKFTPHGSVTVRAAWSVAATRPDRGELTLVVEDTGIGIPAAKIPLLFEAFTQVDPSPTRQEGGTGLGLSICRRMAESLGGSIRLESTLNVGTTCTFRLESDIVTAAVPGRAPVAGDAAPIPIWSRALVVDDVKLNRELLKVMLRRLGLEADVAAGGAEAVRLAADSRYAIIFTDLEMPEMDGFATARAIREQEPIGRHTPIVAVSALTTSGTREKCITAGMDDYLTKPVYLPALRSVIETLLPRFRVESQAPFAVTGEEASR